jgi:integrase
MYRGSDNQINGHHIYLDDNEDPILLPCVFSRFTQCAQYKVERSKEEDENTGRAKIVFHEIEIGEDAAYKISSHLGRYLEWVNNYKTSRFISLNTHTALPGEIVNEYINEYLIDECMKSEFVANQAVNSLNAYYDWISYYFGNKSRHIGIKPKFRKTARNNSKGALAVKYLVPATRELYYRNADNLLQEIVLRNGGDLGCRAKENQGFLLNDFVANKEKYTGLRTLFKQLEKKPEQDVFEYHLSSLYTKYGRSRTLYIPRHLLQKMKSYYDEERPKSDSNHLLVINSSNNRGECISKTYACRIFFDIKNKLMQKIKDNPSLYNDIQEIHESFSYHVMRHSFGTDIFYNMCEGQNKKYESITTTSAVYIETARRMGHKVDGRGANDVTKSYIHACGYRETLLKGIVNGI